MHPIRLLIPLIAAVPALHHQTVTAQSLFERRSPAQIDPYRNVTAHNRGDILTIVINESTDVENIDERSLDKTGNSLITGDASYGLGGGLGNAVGNASVNQTGSTQRGFTGDTEFRSEREFTDRFTVTVVDVMPNGNLVVKGSRRIAVQGDTRKLVLKGVVRPVDLLTDNTVPSRLVAELNIGLEGKGAEQKFIDQGWLGKRLNRIWPF